MAGAFQARYRTDQPSPSSINCTVGATRSGVNRGGIADQAEDAGAELSGIADNDGVVVPPAVGVVAVPAGGGNFGLPAKKGGGGGGGGAPADAVGKEEKLAGPRGDPAMVDGGVAVEGV